MESRYSSTVIPLAWAWAKSPASTSGFKLRVTVIASSMLQCNACLNLTLDERQRSRPGAFLHRVANFLAIVAEINRNGRDKYAENAARCHSRSVSRARGR